jgi:hypothetical protein
MAVNGQRMPMASNANPMPRRQATEFVRVRTMFMD